MKTQLISGVIILVVGIGTHFLLQESDYTFFSGVFTGLGVGLILANLIKKDKTNGQNSDR